MKKEKIILIRLPDIIVVDIIYQNRERRRKRVAQKLVGLGSQEEKFGGTFGSSFLFRILNDERKKRARERSVQTIDLIIFAKFRKIQNRKMSKGTFQ